MKATNRTLPITEFRIFDEFENEVLSFSFDLRTAKRELAEWRGKRQHNEINLLAVVNA